MVIHRVLLVGVCVWGVSATTVAAADGPTGGLVVGTNISSAQLTGADAAGITTGTRAGLFLGGVARLPITDVVAIQPEAAYSQKRFTVHDAVSSFTGSAGLSRVNRSRTAASRR